MSFKSWLTAIAFFAGLIPAAHAQITNCASPNYYVQQFHPGCLSWTDLNNAFSSPPRIGFATPSTGRFSDLTVLGTFTASGAFNFNGIVGGNPTFTGTPVFALGPTFNAAITVPAITATTTATVGGLAQFNGNSSGTSIQAARNISLGSAIGAGGNVAIKTPNGSNIQLAPQGSANVQVLSALTAYQLALSTPGGPPIVSGNMTPLLSVSNNIAGNVTTAGVFGWNGITVGADTVNATGASGVLTDFFVNHNYGGTNFSGSRLGIQVALQQTGAIAAPTIVAGIGAGVTSNNSWGGTGLYELSGGSITGINPYITFASGTTNFYGGSGMEVNVSGRTGASYTDEVGILIAHDFSHAISGVRTSSAIVIGDQPGAVPWKEAAFLVGNRQGGAWPLGTAGSIIKAELGLSYTTYPSSTAYGADFLLGTFSKAAFRSQGFQVDGSGNARIGRTYFTDSTGGITVDPTGSVGLSATIAAGGSGYVGPSTYYGTDIYGGVWKYTIAAGAVTAVTMYRAPYVQGTTPANPIALTSDRGQPGTGTTINITWQGGGNVVLGTGTAIATNATTGMIQVPTMAGTPTGTVGAAGKAALVVDTTNKKICYSIGGGTWTCSAAFTP